MRPALVGGLAPGVGRHGLLRGPGAPLTWLLLFFPLWWALGLGGLIFFIVAVPMAISLLRRDRVEIPPGFGIWLLFCLVVLVSAVAIGLTPEGTMAGSWTGRVFGVAFRLVGYASATIICLYTVNLSESDFPRRRLVNLLAATGVITVVGGLLGTVAGHLEFTSPMEALLPESLASDQFVQSLVHPQAAQVMDFLGYETPRPAAPWGYTNTWGNMLAIAAPWIAVAVACYPVRPRVKYAAVAILAVALIPTVYSMNRGLWLNLAVAGVFVAVRFLACGRWWPLTVLAVTGVVALAAVLVTPLGQIVAARAANGHSDDGRGYATMRALAAVPESPILGFGSTRQTVGSGESIAVGPTKECPRCGGRTLGGNGQLWQVLFAHGVTGALAFVGFFVAVLWRFRRDHSAIGIVASVVMVLSLTSMFYYNALVAPLVITLLCYALLWRNERDRAVEGTT
ncbi:O-antigen ligase family protein [Stackebrandtia nassauensis]|uniref:O-antigen polymerase n=1 Tax=Stackebrandtia nassauensis (strain DSM 44728 / CIP 108903 / NRRL B-16338 / NBRC 102104 / LLR-40K-21) TaxID=446470 RepID=D3Q950_STANL|nr:hypothetical protein [Stackebrandtia nassauensis]ADD40659.1 hypothetical protein Snas_0948 [Stackebrandtia nassauensis DSM 44728]